MNKNFSRKNKNPSLDSMSKRLGVFLTPPPKVSNPFKENENSNADLVDLEGLDHMKVLLENAGGHLQQERMIYDKRRTLDRAVLYSYQGALIVKDGLDDECRRPFRALMNPNKNKPDYDEKILSVGYEYGIKPGDTFEWKNTKTHWIVYLQDLTELAYFRGNVRRCSYEISWEDEDGNIQKTYAAVRGPVETQINFIQKHQISVDEPNHSLNILIPRNEETLKYFRRYSKFYLQGTDEGSPEVCWRVEATDWISTPGILEITAEEYYINRTEDDVEEGLVGVLRVEPVDPNPIECSIEGEYTIKPRMTYTYVYTGDEVADWRIDGSYPVTIVSKEGNTILIKTKSNTGGSFELCYGNTRKIIKVESLF